MNARQTTRLATGSPPSAAYASGPVATCRQPPSEHLVDAAYIDAELLVHSSTEHGITLRGPARPNPHWQAKVEGAYTLADFTVDWEHQEVYCPQGKAAASWAERVDATGRVYIQVRFHQTS